jgi:Flp pilus assembly protein TadD
MDARIERYRKMVEQAPEHELPRFSLGKALFDLEQYSEALEHFKVAIQKKPDWMAVQILIARCQINLGDKTSARQALEHARQLAIKQKHEGPLAEVEALLEEV